MQLRRSKVGQSAGRGPAGVQWLIQFCIVELEARTLRGAGRETRGAARLA
jgi:hypothetical protein